MNKPSPLSFFLLASFLAFSCVGPQVHSLTCETLANPLGIDNTSPHFSWKVEGDIDSASAYRIQVASSLSNLKSGKADLWDSGMVESSNSVMVPYAGRALQPSDECYWRVRVWGEGKSSGWSEPARFSVGKTEGLEGDYIGAFEGSDISPVFRNSFVAGKGDEIFVHVNSLGYHELYINGRKVGESVLSPAVSQLDRRSLTMTYDISEHLVPGRNEIAVWAGKGWYTAKAFDAVYHGPLIKVQVDRNAGQNRWEPILVTDKSWTACDSGYRSPGNSTAWNFGGETIDARRFASEEEIPVDVVAVSGIEETPMMCPPNVVKETVAAVSVTELDTTSVFVRDLGPETGRCWLVDMGRSVIGQVEYHFSKLPEGTRILSYYADNIRKDGILENDEFISSGSEQGDTFRNRFCFHAFRYAVITGCQEAPSPEDVCVHVIRTDYRDASSFECSDPDINAIHDLIKYTLSVLTFSGYQVDCPHIERLGYGGDGNSSTVATQTMYDLPSLYYNWLQAWGDVMEEDGSLPHTAPSPYSAGGGPYWCGFIIMAPYRTMMDYGDIRTAEKLYDKMKLWLGYVDRWSVDGLLKRWPDTPHRGWYLGDWIAPAGIDVTDPLSIDIINNCSLSQNLAALSEIALKLGRHEDSEIYARRRDSLNVRIHKAFFNPSDTTYASRSELDMLYPMLVGAVPPELYDAVKRKMLRRSTEVYNDHIAEGLVGIPILARWAVRDNQPDFVYRKLKQRDCPGYLYMLENGGTTTWEYWDGNRSFIHNCFNGIGSWFYQAIGGIVPTSPGYRTFRIAPQIPEGIDYAKVSKETPYGTIKVSWKKSDEGIGYDITVPVGTTAEFIGQSGKSCLLNGGRYGFSSEEN